MDERLRGKGDYSFEDLMEYTSVKEDWKRLESVLNQDYMLHKVMIEDSKQHRWGINYRVGQNTLCYIHPE